MNVPISKQGSVPRHGDASAVSNSVDGGIEVFIDRFVIIRKIGEGGMGEVFLARHPVTGMEVAIKRLKPELVRDGTAVRRFMAEARHMYHLNHPRILRIMEVWDPPAGPYYVMPHMPKGPLSGALREGQPADYVLALTVARDLAVALSYAHEKGIIHRDMKPANVLMDSEGHASLSDFGLVREFGTNDSVTDGSPSFCEGTAPYMSPAVARGEVEDTRCDIYSFGALLYELLTGHRPYGNQEESMQNTLLRIAAGPPPSILEFNPSAPAGLLAVAEGCMARELHQRYANMADVVADLELVASGGTPMGPHRKRPMKSRFIKLSLLFFLICMTASWGIYRQFVKTRIIDLLQNVDIEKDASGGVSHDPGGTLTLSSTPENQRVWLRFAYMPRGEYDYLVDFVRTSGNDGLDECLSYKGHAFCWTLGGVQNTTSSFWWVGSGGFGSNPTTAVCSACLKNGSHHLSKVEVRSGRVMAYLDGVLISEYSTDYSDVHFPKPEELPDVWGKRLGLSVLNSDVTIYKVQVVEHPSGWGR